MNKITRLTTAIIAGAVILFTGSAALFAVEPDDGFEGAQKAEGKYVTIQYPSPIEPATLLRLLDSRPSEKLLANKPLQQSFSARIEELADAADTLYSQVCDILDMDLSAFHVAVKVCNDQAEINGVYNSLFQKDLGGRYSFYVYNANTIYISQAHFTQEILGHEMSHAVMSHYFVVQPSIRIQEVLAMYVEYSLRKIKQQ